MKHLTLLALIPFFLLRDATVASGWALLLNLVILPVAAGLAALIWMKTNRGLLISTVALVLSPLMTHPLFEAPMLMCVGLLILSNVKGSLHA